jgi:hypothetical protein
MVNHGLENRAIGIIVDAVFEWEIDSIVFASAMASVLGHM